MSCLADVFGDVSAVSRALPPAAVAAEAGETRDGIDADDEAAALFLMTQCLTGPVLVGLFTPDDALALLDRHLDGIFR